MLKGKNMLTSYTDLDLMSKDGETPVMKSNLSSEKVFIYNFMIWTTSYFFGL